MSPFFSPPSLPPAQSGVLDSQKKLLDDRSFRQLLRRATLTLVVVLLVPMIVLAGLVQLLRRSAHWVDHSDRVIAEANHVEKLLITMQSGFRGYRLLRENSVLATYRTARGEIGPHFQLLAELVSDNPKQTEAVRRLKTDAERWMQIAESSLVSIAGGASEESLRSDLLAARSVVNSAMNSAHRLIVEEEQLRTERDATLNEVFRTLVTLFAVAIFAGIPIGAVGLNRLLRKVVISYRASLLAIERRAGELQVTLSSIGDAVIATDSQGLVDFLNPAAEHLLGWLNAEAHGRALDEIFPIFNEQTGAVAANPVARVLKENIVVGLANHTVLRNRHGREYPIEDSAAPIRDEQGRVLGVILVFHDVTEKRAAERQLRESEWQLRFLNELGDVTRPLTEPAEIMAATTRLLGEYLQASRCAYAEVAAHHEDFSIVHDYCSGCPSIVGNYRVDSFGPNIAAQLRTGSSVTLDQIDEASVGSAGAAAFRALQTQAVICQSLIKPDGLRALLAVGQTTPRRWTAAETRLIAEVVERCWATIARARTEADLRRTREQVENEARAAVESANRFRVLSEVVALQVWTANVDGTLDYANHECGDYFGGEVGRDVLGNAWTQFVHPEDMPAAALAWQTALATGQRYEIEFRLKRNDGVFRWFLARAEAMRDADGQIVKWFGTNTDIDDLKCAQAAAERANRTKDEFLAALSHELRTPLTPVLLTAAALRDDEKLPAETREQLGMIERNIALEARLIDDLLDLTIISRGKLQLRAEPCDAHSLIGLAIEIVRNDAREKGIPIEREFSASHHGIIADPARFQQVIWNLLRNAVKFTSRGGKISVSTREVVAPTGAHWLRIEVTDSGIGIDAESIKQIFLPFNQGALAGTHRFGGLGLGLAIAKAVVDLHGGRISAHSAGIDRGATFVVEFPNAIEPPQGTVAASQLPATTPPRRVAPLRLLLVEDHESTLQTLRRLLNYDGHQIVTASTVAQAIALAATARFDLVISDLGLPDGTGTELMEKLRDAYGLRGIALSGYGMEEDLARSREAGFVAHLVKPVRIAELQRVLASLSKA